LFPVPCSLFLEVGYTAQFDPFDEDVATMSNDSTRVSRREFGKIALAGVPLSLAIARLEADTGVRIGVQSYSFRTLPLDEAIAAMSRIGLKEVELFSGHVEPAFGPRPAPVGDARPPRPSPEEMQKRREEVRKFRLETPLDHFTGVGKKFQAAGIKVQAYNLSFNDSFTDEEIDRGFEIAKALGAGFLTASSTVSSSKRVAPFADKHKFVVAMHNHSNLKDPNEFATPESFATAMSYSKFIKVNLDIGHFTAANFDAIDYIQKNHANITNLHLKDRKKDQGANVPWGEGDTPIKEVLLLLRKNKYDIPANIEFEYKGDPLVEVPKCLDYCKTALT
jgi:sugar phosphate isomerase/epimerase